MAWPTTGAAPSSNLALDGDISYARLGTDELLPTTPTYVVLSARQRLKKEDEDYNNGDGLQSGRIRRYHGVTWEVTVRDRTDISPPKVGQLWSIVDMAGHMGNSGNYTYTARVLDPGYEANSGKPGERTVTFEHVFLIEGGAVSRVFTTGT